MHLHFSFDNPMTRPGINRQICIQSNIVLFGSAADNNSCFLLASNRMLYDFYICLWESVAQNITCQILQKSVWWWYQM